MNHDECLLRSQPPEMVLVANHARASRMGSAERHAGARAQVSGLPGRVRGVVDRTRIVARRGNVPALGDRVSVHRFLARSVHPTSGPLFAEGKPTMPHTIVSHEKWSAARKELLEAEKELTRRSDELARRRQELPWVRIDKQYRFEIDDGSAALADLFRGRSQLLIYHFMFGPDYKSGCPSCSSIAD